MTAIINRQMFALTTDDTIDDTVFFHLKLVISNHTVFSFNLRFICTRKFLKKLTCPNKSQIELETV